MAFILRQCLLAGLEIRAVGLVLNKYLLLMTPATCRKQTGRSTHWGAQKEEKALNIVGPKSVLVQSQ